MTVALSIVAALLVLGALVWRRGRAKAPDPEHEAFVQARGVLCRRAAEALAKRPGATWVREMAPLTQAERALVWSTVAKARSEWEEVEA